MGKIIFPEKEGEEAKEQCRRTKNTCMHSGSLRRREIWWGGNKATTLACVYLIRPLSLARDFQQSSQVGLVKGFLDMVMILPQVHLRKPCYDFYFL